jgi:Flp pilus assembly protein TadG
MLVVKYRSRKLHPNFLNGERGATFVEFSLVFLLVFTLIVVIIDTARYALALNSASFAARQILDKAKTDSSIVADVRNASGSQDATRFVESRDRVLALGLMLPGKAMEVLEN